MGFGVRFRDQVGAEFGAPAGGWRAVCRGPVAGGSQEGGRAVAGLAGAQGLVSLPARGSPPTGLRIRAGLPRDLPSLPPLPALQAQPARQCERPIATLSQSLSSPLAPRADPALVFPPLQKTSSSLIHTWACAWGPPLSRSPPNLVRAPSTR